MSGGSWKSAVPWADPPTSRVRGKRADVSADSLVRTYEREVERQRQLVRKAEYTQHCLMFVSGALRELLADENFVNLLRAEKLETLPKYLAERVWHGSIAP
jgi:ParB family chromosome partitioning protein